MRLLQICPPCGDDHVMAYSGIDVVVQAEADDAVVVGVEGTAGMFAEDRAESVDEWFPDVGPVAARSGRMATSMPMGPVMAAAACACSSRSRRVSFHSLRA